MNIIVPPPDTNYKVMVRCFTYNQSSYIDDAMNGFCMQETNFPFVCTIVDDASTDGEPEVIRNYLQEYFDLEDKAVVRNEETDDYVMTFAQHKKNKNCYFAVYLLKYNHYSIKKPKWPYLYEWYVQATYIAICEGDDYWTMGSKLQKQVAFLDSNNDYSMCFHQALVHYESNKYPDHHFSNIEEREYTGLELFPKWTVPTASIVMRKTVLNSELYKKLSKDKRIIYGDLKTVIACTNCGRVYGYADTMSIYRRVKGSLTEETSSAHMYKVSKMMQAYKELLGEAYAEKCKRTISYVLVRAFYKSFFTHESNLRWVCIKDALINSYLYTFKSLILFPFRYSKKGGRGKVR